MSKCYYYITPTGKYKTIQEVLDNHPEITTPSTVYKRCNSKAFPDWVKRERLPKTHWMSKPIDQLSHKLQERKRKWEHTRRQERQKKNRKFQTEDERRQYMSDLMKRMTAEHPEWIEKRVAAWRVYNDNLTPEDYKKRGERKSELYWSRIKDVEKHKDALRKKNNKYSKNYYRKKRKELRKQKVKERRDKDRRLQGFKIWNDDNRNHYHLYNKGHWELYLVCPICGSEKRVRYRNTHTCSPECGVELWRKVEWSTEMLNKCVAEGLSVRGIADKYGVAYDTVYNAFTRYGIAPPVRSYTPTTSHWSTVSRQALRNELKDDDSTTGDRYLPDEIEEQMDELDDFFK